MKMFSKGPKKEDAKDKVKNPYLNGRNSWNSALLEISSSRNVWQLIAIICLLIALSTIIGITYIGSQSKFVPYIVEVDKHGETFVAGKVESRLDVNEQIYKAMVANFINKTRSVSTDFNVQKDNVYKVYAYINQGDPAEQKLHRWFNPIAGKGETPFVKAGRGESADVAIQSIIQISPSSWQIDWVETYYSNKGLILTEDSYRAVLDLYQLEPEINNLNATISNPLNIFVKDFRWTSRQ